MVRGSRGRVGYLQRRRIRWDDLEEVWMGSRNGPPVEGKLWRIPVIGKWFTGPRAGSGLAYRAQGWVWPSLQGPGLDLLHYRISCRQFVR